MKLEVFSYFKEYFFYSIVVLLLKPTYNNLMFFKELKHGTASFVTLQITDEKTSMELTQCGVLWHPSRSVYNIRLLLTPSKYVWVMLDCIKDELGPTYYLAALDSSKGKLWKRFGNNLNRITYHMSYFVILYITYLSSHRL